MRKQHLIIPFLLILVISMMSSSGIIFAESHELPEEIQITKDGLHIYLHTEETAETETSDW